MNTDTTKSKRVTYNFKLEFPTQFTMRELRQKKSHKVSYITLYMRVKNALKKGTLEVVGLCIVVLIARSILCQKLLLCWTLLPNFDDLQTITPRTQTLVDLRSRPCC
jgi:hypothetical protein